MTIPLLHNHFQLGFVVRDTQRAIDNLRVKFGIEHWRVLEMPPGLEVRLLSFAMVGEMLFELIELNPGREMFYLPWIPQDPSAVRLNHFGYKMHSQEQWDRTRRAFEAAGFDKAVEGSLGGVNFCYYDTVAQLGHYCELNYLEPEAADFFDAPQN